jgi:hypothetical protein
VEEAIHSGQNRARTKSGKLSELIVRRNFLSMVAQMDLRLASTGQSQPQIEAWYNKTRFGGSENLREYSRQNNRLMLKIPNHCQFIIQFEYEDFTNLCGDQCLEGFDIGCKKENLSTFLELIESLKNREYVLMSFETVEIISLQKILDFGRDMIENLHCAVGCFFVDRITDSDLSKDFRKQPNEAKPGKGPRMDSGFKEASGNDQYSRRKSERLPKVLNSHLRPIVQGSPFWSL